MPTTLRCPAPPVEPRPSWLPSRATPSPGGNGPTRRPFHGCGRLVTGGKAHGTPYRRLDREGRARLRQPNRPVRVNLLPADAQAPLTAQRPELPSGLEVQALPAGVHQMHGGQNLPQPRLPGDLVLGDVELVPLARHVRGCRPGLWTTGWRSDWPAGGTHCSPARRVVAWESTRSCRRPSRPPCGRLSSITSPPTWRFRVGCGRGQMAELIFKMYGIRFTEPGGGRYLKRWELTFQRPTSGR
ncbi:winged helix-turn-helix domain-containing protein [Streptomyces castrisilvae]|uniref:winged helix-turn-helix domain-containing protein n=1 Tax=Streptomyces castrisilvae TaxID=3033811 RepID=UPI0040555562